MHYLSFTYQDLICHFFVRSCGPSEPGMAFAYGEMLSIICKLAHFTVDSILFIINKDAAPIPGDSPLLTVILWPVSFFNNL